MNKLRDQKGLTMVELLVTVVIVLLFSGLVAVGADAGVRSFRTSMADAQAQELCSTLTTALSDKLRYCTVENDTNRIFFQDVGYVDGTIDSVFSVNGDGQLELGGKRFLGKAAYPQGLKIKNDLSNDLSNDFSISFADNTFTVSFQIINRENTTMASADFQVKRINLEDTPVAPAPEEP